MNPKRQIFPLGIWFNRNMGCIEIDKDRHNNEVDRKFNRNMGCIEIPQQTRSTLSERKV